MDPIESFITLDFKKIFRIPNDIVSASQLSTLIPFSKLP